MTRVAFLVALVLPACTVATETETEPEPTPGTCAVELSEQTTSLSEGGRARLALSVEGEVSALTAVTSTGEVRIEDTTLVAKPAYGTGGTSMSVTLQFECGGQPQETAIDFDVRAIRWSALPTWTPGTDGPLNREYGNMWIDQENPDRMLAFGGFHYQPQQFTPANELWQFDLVNNAWTQLNPVGAPLRPGAGLALIGGQEAIYYGGLVDGSTTPFAMEHLNYAGDTPTFTSIDIMVGPLGGPSGDYQPSFLWDAPRERLISACGLRAGGGHHCDVRAIDRTTGESTTLAAAGEAPVGRNGQLWVHDEMTERLILFSGDRGDAMCDCEPDAWALELSEDPVRWVPIAMGSPPVGRRNGAFALDHDGHRMFVWGGTPDGASAAPGIFALDLDRGAETWHLVEPEGEPPPDRASGAAVYDAARQRLVMGFGNSSAGNFTDLWALEL